MHGADLGKCAGILPILAVLFIALGSCLASPARVGEAAAESLGGVQTF